MKDTQTRGTAARIRLIATGGTVSSIETASDVDGATPGVDAAAILSRATLPRGIVVETEDYARVLSSELSLADVYGLGGRIDGLLRDRADLAGVVVTHGTGTLEESAFMTSLIVRDPRPVVFTGAMRRADDPYGDGPANLSAAIRVAVAPAAHGRGTLIVFADRILDPLDASKVHTTDFAAFASTGYGPLGYVYPDCVDFGRRAAKRLRPPTANPDFNVALIKFVIGMDDTLIRAVTDAGVSGLVIEASGLGNVNEVVATALLDALRRGITVVLASRVSAGRVYAAYATKGGGAYLARAGCILSSLPGPKARILLMFALGAGLPRSRMRRLFDP